LAGVYPALRGAVISASRLIHGNLVLRTVIWNCYIYPDSELS
jgi:hypothetical protein